jgi:hypothetical protein
VADEGENNAIYETFYPKNGNQRVSEFINISEV